MVPLFGFLKHVQVAFEIFLFRPGRAIDTLQLLILRIAAPVSASNLHEFEMFEFAGRWHVWPTAKVNEIALAVKRYVLIGRNGSNQFCLVAFALPFEKFHGIITRPDFTSDWNVFLGQLSHALFDSGKIIRRKRARVSKVVIEAIFNRRPNGYLGIRIKFFNGIGQQMRRGVADQVQPFRVFIGNDGERAICFDQIAGVDQLVTVFGTYSAAQGSAGKAGTNTGSNVQHRNRLGIVTLGTVRQGNDWHLGLASKKKTTKKPEQVAGVALIAIFGESDSGFQF